LKIWEGEKSGMVRRTRGKTAPPIVQVARENRREMTQAEEKLWGMLRERRVAGLKFRKQHPLGHFVLDFFCVEQLLAIEVDGDSHYLPEQRVLDQERTRQLADQGVRVLRFPNELVINSPNQVVAAIVAFIQDHPLRTY
jgi:very-short-patch-repair endonuclease